MIHFKGENRPNSVKIGQNMAIMLDIGPSNPNIWWVFFKYGNICLYNARVCTHTLFKQRKVRQIDVQAQKLSKMTKKCPKCSFRAFEGPSRVVFFQDIGMSAYVIHKCIHIHYLNKEKFAQIKLLAQKQSKTVKNCSKCSFRASVGPYAHISWS